MTRANIQAPGFTPGRNMAMKVPPPQHKQTVAFYRDVVGLELLRDDGDSVMFRFGEMRLWIDSMPSLEEAQIWLEICCDNVAAAEAALSQAEVTRCDEVEVLPDDFRGFWIRNPAGIVHLVCDED